MSRLTFVYLTIQLRSIISLLQIFFENSEPLHIYALYWVSLLFSGFTYCLAPFKHHTKILMWRQCTFLKITLRFHLIYLSPSHTILLGQVPFPNYEEIKLRYFKDVLPALKILWCSFLPDCDALLMGKGFRGWTSGWDSAPLSTKEGQLKSLSSSGSLSQSEWLGLSSNT